MSLHPIKALNHVIDEYRDYLLMEFRAKEPSLREALSKLGTATNLWSQKR